MRGSVGSLTTLKFYKSLSRMCQDMNSEVLLIRQLNHVVFLPLLCCFKEIEYIHFLLSSWEDLKNNSPTCHPRIGEFDLGLLVIPGSIFEGTKSPFLKNKGKDVHNEGVPLIETQGKRGDFLQTKKKSGILGRGRVGRGCWRSLWTSPEEVAQEFKDNYEFTEASGSQVITTTAQPSVRHEPPLPALLCWSSWWLAKEKYTLWAPSTSWPSTHGCQMLCSAWPQMPRSDIPYTRHQVTRKPGHLVGGR